MDRRNFFKLVGTASGGALTGACGKQGQELIPLLVSEEAIVPGTEAWHPGVCRKCSAGCGTIHRVMESEREIEVDGTKVRERIAAIKKIEGNPLDPISGGRLCARGQAAVQGLYHPDRVRGPLRRNRKIEGGFESISWSDVIDEVGSILAETSGKNPIGITYVAGPGTGTRAVVVDRFLNAIGARAATTIGFDDFTVERRASELLHGQSCLPTYEIQEATHVFSLGADFLGGWISPVLYARRFGHFRRGRSGIRGKLTHAESRFSQTAWSADNWLPVAPGGEHALALGIGHLLVQRGIGEGNVPADIWNFFTKIDLQKIADEAGLTVEQIQDTAKDLADATTPLVVPGASIVRCNSLDAVLTAGALNLILGNIGKKGGVTIPPRVDIFEAARPHFEDFENRVQDAEIVFLDGVNPAYLLPNTKALLDEKTVITFAPVLDESAFQSSFVLPDHDPLESGAVVIPEARDRFAMNGSRAFVSPLYDTRATEAVLVDLAQRVGVKIESYLPFEAFADLYGSQTVEAAGENRTEFASYAIRQGGWWGEPKADNVNREQRFSFNLRHPAKAKLNTEYPYRFQAYPSLQFGFGSDSHLPWLQQLPDTTSSSMWVLPLEIDPVLASSIGVVNGDTVRVTSSRGSIEAVVYVHPAAIPGVVSMGIGQGHAEYGRYASGQGVNPLELVGGDQECNTGVPAFGSAVVNIEKISGRPGLIQFAKMDREVLHKRM